MSTIDDLGYDKGHVGNLHTNDLLYNGKDMTILHRMKFFYYDSASFLPYYLIE